MSTNTIFQLGVVEIGNPKISNKLKRKLPQPQSAIGNSRHNTFANATANVRKRNDVSIPAPREK